MKTDTENEERDKYFASSNTRRRQGKSDKSQPNSRTSSRPVPVGDDGKTAETKLSSLDVLLTILQSHLGEIRDFGGAVEFFTHPDALFIKLPNVAICHSHKMMHFGTTCPMC